MADAALASIVAHCDRLLRPREFTDSERAVNGLQVENRGRVTKIAAMVDASLTTVQMAVAAKADLLIVHHGLFWSTQHPWTERRYQLLRLLLDNNLAVYSSHLPLDAHPKLGNNAQIAAALGLKKLKPFYLCRGQTIGFRAEVNFSRNELSARLAKVLGSAPLLLPGGPETCRQLGIVSGGAGEDIAKVAAEGVDTFLTGEGPHWTYALAEDLGLNVFYGGHYLTETFGVKALAAELSKKFRVPWVFLDHPTGL